MTAFVYLLWDHEEHGPEIIRATTNPANLPAIMREAWPTASNEEHKKLVELIAGGSLVSYETYRISDGWGGIHLQAVPLL